MKGAEYTMWLAVTLFLALLIGVVALIFNYSSESGIANLWNDFCAKNTWFPGCGGGDLSTRYYATAKNSVDALRCALSAVATGNSQLSCLNDFKPPSPLAGNVIFGDFPTLGFQTGAETKDKASLECGVSGQVECECIKNYGGIETKLGTVVGVGDGFGVAEKDAKEKCTDMLYKTGIVSRGGSISDPGSLLYPSSEAQKYSRVDNCNTRLRCTLNNFQLPQDFTDITGWIGTMGDPQFVVYYQNFPHGEDSQWSSGSAWFESVGKIMFAGFCVAHFLGPVISLFKSATVVPLTAIKSVPESASILTTLSTKFKTVINFPKIVVNSVRNGIAKVAGGAILNDAIVSQYADDAARFIADNGITGGIAQSQVNIAFNEIKNGELAGVSLAQYMSAGKITSIITQIASQKAASAAVQAVANPRFVLYTGVDSIASYFLARIDSEIGKLTDTYDNSLVLQNTMVVSKLRESGSQLFNHEIKKPSTIVDPLQQNLMDLKSPVILSKPELFNVPTPFYLVSPCHTDLKIEMQNNIICGVYSYDKDRDLIACKSPSEKGILDKVLSLDKYKCGSVPGDHNLEEPMQSIRSKAADAVSNLGANNIFEGTVTITPTDIVCCKYTAAFSEFGRSITVTDWVDRGNCEIYKGETLPDSGCSGSKPSGNLERKKIYDIFDNIILYYNKDANSVDYYTIYWPECQSSTQKCAVIEYEEDAQLTKTNNVWYVYQNGWEWKCPECSDKAYHDYSPVSQMNDAVFSQVDSVHRDIAAALSSASFEDGIKSIENILNQQKDSHGTDTSDDFVKIHYPDGNIIEVLADKIDIHALADIVDICSSKPKKIMQNDIRLGPLITLSTEGILGLYATQGACVQVTSDILKASPDMDEDEKSYYCAISPAQLKNPQSTSLTSVILFVSATAAGKPDVPHSLYIRWSYASNDKLATVFLKDDNLDNKVDSVGFIYVKGILSSQSSVFAKANTYSTIFKDLNGDQTVDFVTSNNCQIDSIVVEPDMSKYSNDEHNYCYKKSYTTTLGLVETLGAFGISALAKTAKVGPVAGWIIGTAVDCAIAYAEYKWGTPQWPS